MSYLCLMSMLLAGVGFSARAQQKQAEGSAPLDQHTANPGNEIPADTQAADEQDPTGVLMRLRDQVLAHGRSIPNHTCVETIQRDRYEPAAGRSVKDCDTLLARRKQQDFPALLRLEQRDRLRLDVSLAYQGEIYSWAGARRFEEGEITDLIPAGAIGTGPFASLLLGVFDARNPGFAFEGDTTREGRGLMEYSFTIPQDQSRYRIRAGAQWVTTGYTGTLLVDPRTAALVRMTVRTEEPPPETNLCEIDTVMEYGLVALGGGDYLLPKTARERYINRDGEEAENSITFGSCREFRSESTLAFGERPPGEPQAPGRTAATLELPARVPVTVELATPILADQAAAGDRIEGRLVHAIRDARQQILAPEGALVAGRLMRAETRGSSLQELTIALHWETLEVNGREIPLTLVPNRQMVHADKGPAGLKQRSGVEIVLPLPGESRYGVYHFPGGVVKSGFRTEWLTAAH